MAQLLLLQLFTQISPLEIKVSTERNSHDGASLHTGSVIDHDQP